LLGEQCQSVGRIGGVGSHWWHMAGLKSSSKMNNVFKITFQWTDWWCDADI